MQKKINILTTAWNRVPERFNYFKVMVESVKEKVNWGEYIPDWIVSIEEKDHYLRKEMEEFCLDHGIHFFYHRPPAGLGRNTNYALSLCSEPAILFVQDDCIAVEPLEIWKDIDWFFSEEAQKIGVLRYYAHFDRDNDRGHMKLINDELDIYKVSPEATYYMNFHVHLRKLEYHGITGPYDESFKFKSKKFPNGIDGGVAENRMVTSARKVSAILGIAYKRCAINKEERSFGNYFGKQKVLLEHSTLMEKQARARERNIRRRRAAKG